MDVFVFLLGGVNFLLLLFLTAVEVRCEVNVSVLEKAGGEVLFGKDGTLTDQSESVEIVVQYKCS
jgi:hypothetical protein